MREPLLSKLSKSLFTARDKHSPTTDPKSPSDYWSTSLDARIHHLPSPPQSPRTTMNKLTIKTIQEVLKILTCFSAEQGTSSPCAECPNNARGRAQDSSWASGLSLTIPWECSRATFKQPVQSFWLRQTRLFGYQINQPDLMFQMIGEFNKLNTSPLTGKIPSWFLVEFRWMTNISDTE